MENGRGRLQSPCHSAPSIKALREAKLEVLIVADVCNCELTTMDAGTLVEWEWTTILR